MSSTLPFMPADDEHLDVSALETWLWDAACAIRGATDAPKFKDFILPLVFYKRLSDVFDDEFARYAKEYGDAETAHAVIEADHTDALKQGRRGIVRFYIPQQYAWRALRHYPADGSLGQFVTTALREVARINPDLQGVLDAKDFNEWQRGPYPLNEESLAELIEALTRHRLGLRITEPDILGRAYECLLYKFAEGLSKSGPDFSTPKEVGWLLAELIHPTPNATVYDPCCGLGSLLTKTRFLFEHAHPDARTQAPRLYGQELNPVIYAMAKMNMFLHDYTDACLALGDTLRTPRIAAEGAGLQHFEYVVANPPWNLDGYDERFYDHDKYSRFGYGIPPKSSADWGWVQHVLTSLSDTGRAAVVLDAGAASRGSSMKSGSKERDIRKALVEADIIEGVVLLPENLFYNTSAQGIVLLLNRHKPAERRGQFLMVNASAYYGKTARMNVLSEDGIKAVTEAYRSWTTREHVSQVVTLEEVRASNYNLSPGHVIIVNTKIPPVFVSHSHVDNAYCDIFVRTLREAGANVWYDEENLGAGHLGSEIDMQLYKRPVFIVILSKAAFASDWVLREAALAKGYWTPTSGREIIPVAAQRIGRSDFERAMKGNWAPLSGFRRFEGPGGEPLPPEEAAQQVIRWLIPPPPRFV